MTYLERFTPDPCPTDYMRWFWNGWEIVNYDDWYELNDADGNCVAAADNPEWLAEKAAEREAQS
jgi:hypothetical protein